MLETSVYKKSKATEDLQLAIRSYLEYIYRLGGNYRLALDSIKEHAEIAWDFAYNQIDREGQEATENAVHPLDASTLLHNRTNASSFTFREGVKE